MRKLNQEQVAEASVGYWDNIETLRTLQTAVYVMVGGGHLGRFAAEQPGKFYIDDRVGRLPYGRREIYQAVATLCTMARLNGLNPNKLDEMPRFHNCGVF